MEDDLDILEEKQQDLEEKIEKVSEMVQSLKNSNKKLARKIEKVELANQNLQEENENLQQKIVKTQKSLTNLKQSPESKNLRIRRSLTMFTPIVIEVKASSSEEESEDLDDVISDDPNLELYLKQIHELKGLCKEQNELMLKFQETMDCTKDDNNKLQTVLSEIEQEKKGISEIFGNVEARQSQLFEHFGHHPEVDSLESSMFISALNDGELGHNFNRQKHEEQLKLHKPSFPFVKKALLHSHISALKL